MRRFKNASSEGARIVAEQERKHGEYSKTSARLQERSLNELDKRCGKIGINRIQDITRKHALEYLADRSKHVPQKTLDTDKLVLEMLLRGNNMLGEKETLARVESTLAMINGKIERAYEGTYYQATQYQKSHGQELANMTVKMATKFLQERSKYVIQKTLGIDRRALEKLLRYNNNLGESETLPIMASTKRTPGRSTGPITIDYFRGIKARQDQVYVLASNLMFYSGLRPHEIYTLRKPADQALFPGSTHPEIFAAMDRRVIYTVVGHNGLIRGVAIRTQDDIALEKIKLDQTKTIYDHNKKYESWYSIAGGKCGAQSLMEASKITGGCRTSFRDLRQTYAKTRMTSLMRAGLSKTKVIDIIGLEMGDTPKTVKKYLRTTQKWGHEEPDQALEVSTQTQKITTQLEKTMNNDTTLNAALKNKGKTLSGLARHVGLKNISNWHRTGVPKKHIKKTASYLKMKQADVKAITNTPAPDLENALLKKARKAVQKRKPSVKKKAVSKKVAKLMLQRRGNREILIAHIKGLVDHPAILAGQLRKIEKELEKQIVKSIK